MSWTRACSDLRRTTWNRDFHDNRRKWVDNRRKPPRHDPIRQQNSWLQQCIYLRVMIHVTLTIHILVVTARSWSQIRHLFIRDHYKHAGKHDINQYVLTKHVRVWHMWSKRDIHVYYWISPVYMESVIQRTHQYTACFNCRLNCQNVNLYLMSICVCYEIACI